MGMMTDVPPNPLAMKISAHAPTTFTIQRCTGQGMPRHVTPVNERGQKINAPRDSMLQENYSHRIRRTIATPEATFFCLSLLFSLFLPLYLKCNLTPPLRSYKRGGREDRQKEERKRSKKS
jgi:hypothetical protein